MSSKLVLDETQFKTQYVANFVSSWCAVNYDTACMNGQQTMLNKPPIEDALFLADRAWEHYCFLFDINND